MSIYTPACLAPKDADYTGKTASVYGWGQEKDAAELPCLPQPPLSPVLKGTTQTIISNKDCEQGSGFAPCCSWTGTADLYEYEYGYEYDLCEYSMKNRTTDDMLCGYNYNSETDACQGDSGGPFTVEESGKHTLVGVVSWGLGCARVSIQRLHLEL